MKKETFIEFWFDKDMWIIVLAGLFPAIVLFAAMIVFWAMVVIF